MKIEKELKELEQHGVITQTVANDIRAYCNRNKKPINMMLLFGVLGAVFSGLGIILILAHNWDDLSRTIKTVVAFLPLVIGQLFVFYGWFRKKTKAWMQTSGTFLFFAIGSSISLVSQIYNIDLQSFLLTWILLSCPMIYLLKSEVLGLIHIIMITYYASVGNNFSNSEDPWLYIPLLLFIVPQYIGLIQHRNSDNITAVFHWLIPGSFFIALPQFCNGGFLESTLLYIGVSSACYLFGRQHFIASGHSVRNGYRVLGGLGLIIILLMSSFQWFWQELGSATLVWENLGLVSLFSVIVLVLLGYSYYDNKRRVLDMHEWTFPVFLIALGLASIDSIATVIMINMFLFAIGLNAIRKGVKTLSFASVNYGMVLITVLVLCRFFDMEMHILLRGVLFVCVGLGFFITNYSIVQKQKKKSDEN